MAWRISLSNFADEARTMILAREGSSRVLPICTSWRSNVPPIIRIVSRTFARINESMICPWSRTVSWSCIISQTCTVIDGPHRFYHPIQPLQKLTVHLDSLPHTCRHSLPVLLWHDRGNPPAGCSKCNASKAAGEQTPEAY